MNSSYEDLYIDDNECSLYEYCSECGKDITLEPSEDGQCLKCLTDE